VDVGASRQSAVDRVADRYVDRRAALDPIAATGLGVPGHDAEMPDLSPDGHAARAELDRATLRDLAEAERTRDPDATDAITGAAMRERLGLRIERYEAGEVSRELNVIDSPAQGLRDVFDLMPMHTEAQWVTVATRLRALPDAMTGYLASLRESARAGHVAARRQVEQVAAQCAELAAGDGYFAGLVEQGQPADESIPASVLADLRRGADAAGAAYGELADFLRRELLPQAPSADAVGADRYALASREFLGAVIDQRETYDWGRAELDRIETEMRAVARELTGADDVAAAMTALDDDPARRIHGTDALQSWMQELSDRTLSELAGTHFDIPEPIRRLDCRIAPTHAGGIYYVPPNEDFSRPGTMWWSVPDGVEDFVTWKEVTIVFHEGVPGHHLQCGQTVYRTAELNRWRRLDCWVSGHGEGWALYAERLMGELGYLDDPGARMGMLDSQALRAARVVVDIGVHLSLAAPDEVGGGTWDAAKAWTFLRRHTRVGEAMLRFELDRYLGWPAQAPSYKVGERFWLQLRARAQAAAGSEFDLAAFHRRALDVGSLGLDVLRDALSPAGAAPASAVPAGAASAGWQ
jgi:uncharacterized protein (DUF885 family)